MLRTVVLQDGQFYTIKKQGPVGAGVPQAVPAVRQESARLSSGVAANVKVNAAAVPTAKKSGDAIPLVPLKMEPEQRLVQLSRAPMAAR